ncbi:MAG: hypothetical protein DRP85_03720 [Candidatus Makaraimicrobium thalassicum]|nr:MAG: hypothetical protein DRP85_03720 [Candidatus Omnitrophota bacterium]
MHTVHEYLKMDKDSTPAGKILVTAGPTIEPLDPVRYISNYSTGMMGYEIAAECAERGFDVCLISGPVNLSPPAGVETVGVKTAGEMRDRVVERVSECDCLIMAAAVCDFRPEKEKKHKIKKKETLSVRFVKNTDILLEVGKREGLVKVGFALESENPVENGQNKLKAKSLDMIIINKKDTETDPFGPGEKEYILIDAGGNIKRFEELTKRQMAGVIIGEVEALL